jgi:hypothetical protein
MQGLREETEPAQNTREGLQIKLERSRNTPSWGYSNASHSRTWHVTKPQQATPSPNAVRTDLLRSKSSAVTGPGKSAGPGMCGMLVCNILLEAAVVFPTSH